MRKIRINIGYETGNSFEPYDYIDDYIFVDDDTSDLKIKEEVSKFVKRWHSYSDSHFWEEVDDFYGKDNVLKFLDSTNK